MHCYQCPIADKLIYSCNEQTPYFCKKFNTVVLGGSSCEQEEKKLGKGLLEEIEKVMEEHSLHYAFNQSEYEHFINQIIIKTYEVIERTKLTDEECDQRALLTFDSANKMTPYQAWAFGIGEGSNAQHEADLKAIKETE